MVTCAVMRRPSCSAGLVLGESPYLSGVGVCYAAGVERELPGERVTEQPCRKLGEESTPQSSGGGEVAFAKAVSQ